MVGDDAIPPAMLPPPPCLHDCLALGQIEVGLPRIPPSSDSKNTSTSATENGAASPAAAGAAANTASSSSSNRQNEEIRRLPLLLRWLEQSRPLTLIPTLVGLEEHAAIDDDDDNGSPEERDELIEEAVARLEDRAALFSKAEPVQRVACQLAPSACLRIRRLPPLSRRRRRPQQDAEWYYETTQLQAIALDPLKSAAAAAAAAVNAKGLKKLRRLSGATQTEALDGNGPDELQGRSDSSDNYYEDDLDELGGKEISMDVPSTMSNPDGQNSKTKKRKKQDRRIRTSLELANASEDSLDYMVLKTLQELTRLTVDSLQANASLFLSTEDSILAEPARQQGIGGGGTTSRDLGAILASLMVHAPVLRHEHVAVCTIIH